MQTIWLNIIVMHNALEYTATGEELDLFVRTSFYEKYATHIIICMYVIIFNNLDYNLIVIILHNHLRIICSFLDLYKNIY